MFRLLIRFRYKLIWAQARTGAGKVALLTLLYLFGGALMLVLAAGGFSAGVLVGRVTEAARWLLGALFVGGVVSGVALGTGPRKAFSETALRRYPLTTAERFAARHLTGLLDPNWLLILAASLGLAAGFAFAGGGMAVALSAAVLFVVSCYLTAVLLLSLVERALQYGAGATIVSALVFALFTVGSCALVVLLVPDNRGWLNALDRLTQFTPPGVAAELLTSLTTPGAVYHAAFLIAWCTGAGLALASMERRPARTPRAAAAGVVRWDGGVEALARVAGHRRAPLVAKALRYQLRCHRVLFNLLATPLVVAFTPYLLARGKGADEFIGGTAFVLFFAGGMATHAAALNLFGYDGAGVRRYATMPAAFVSALRAGSYASLLLTLGALLPSVALWWLVSDISIDARTLASLAGSAISGCFFFGALGLWTSVLTPRRADINSVIGNQLSKGGVTVVAGGALVAAVCAVVGARTAGWSEPALLSLACAGLYVASHQLVARVVPARREQIIAVVAGAES